MAEKTLSTRIQLKYDTYENWVAKNPVLKSGEMAIATIPTGTTQEVNSVTAPQILVKVGDGTSNYNDLKFISGLAADVYSWAKASTKPKYSASEIKELNTFVSNLDTDTQYQIIQYSESGKVVNGRYQLQYKGKNDTTWKNVTLGTIDLSTTVNTVGILVNWVGNGPVSDQIDNAINNLHLDQRYEIKGSASLVQSNLNNYKTSNDEAVRAVKATADDASEKINAFLDDNATSDEVIDTLKEIQEFIASDKTATAALLSKVSILEGDSHTHSNKDVLDQLNPSDIDAWNGVVSNYLFDVTTTSGKGLKAEKDNHVVNIDIDDTVTFVLNCGNATL